MREDAQPNTNVQFLLTCASYGLLPWLIKVSSMLQDSSLTKLNLFLQHIGGGLLSSAAAGAAAASIIFQKRRRNSAGTLLLQRHCRRNNGRLMSTSISSCTDLLWQWISCTITNSRSSNRIHQIALQMRERRIIVRAADDAARRDTERDTHRAREREREREETWEKEGRKEGRKPRKRPPEIN